MGQEKAQQTYWERAARPWPSLVFVVPMLLIYEAGVLLAGPSAVRNGADVWLRQFLDAIGFGQYFLLPVLTCGALLAWHHTSRDTWKLNQGLLAGMLLEAMVLAFMLVLLGQLQGSLFSRFAPSQGSIAAITPQLAQLIGYFGAGIYEEVLFRLVLLPLVVGVLRAFGFKLQASWVISILLTSFLFSAAHYQVFTGFGDAFDWFSFTFRFLAGATFGAMFVYRGFGITVGAHALYDIYVALLM